MSNCRICSKPLAYDADITCNKHHAEFERMDELVKSGKKEPPFGLSLDAWSESAFAEIGYVIYSNQNRTGPYIVEDVEAKIKEIVERRNRDAAVDVRNKQKSPETKEKIQQFARTLGLNL